jgi:hypothetical protein
MAISTQLEGVLETQDGPWICYDTTVTGQEIYELWQTGFVKLDPERQRGKDTVSGKLVRNEKKIERWTEELIAGTAILGQLSWNFRKGETTVEYVPAERKLKVSGGASVPDSYHRCTAIVQATESHKKGSAFDPSRKFSVRIYHVTKEEENRIFYAMNQEGEPADPGRSKWLYPKEPTQRLAAELVRTTPGLGDNIDTVRDRLSKRNWRVATFGTISKAIEDAWGSVPGLERDEVFKQNLEWLYSYWRQVLRVLPELGKLDFEDRKRVRDTSLIDSANSIYALFYLGRRIKDTGHPLKALEGLSQPVTVNGDQVPFLSRANPDWEKRGVLAPGEKMKDGKLTLVLRNSRQARNALIEAMLAAVGVPKQPAAAA